MKYDVVTDDEGYVVLIRHTGTPRDFVELDLSLYDFEDGRLNAHYLTKNGLLIFDRNRYASMQAAEQAKQNKEEIAVLEDRLTDTDYVCVKQIDDMIVLSSEAIHGTIDPVPGSVITDDQAMKFLKSLMYRLNKAMDDYGGDIATRAQDREAINTLRETI